MRLASPFLLLGDAPGCCRVLIVDDNATVRQTLCSILENSQKLVVVGEAADGLEAIALTSTIRPDVVIMDVNMPKMNGVDATKHIKATQPATIVIGLSVNSTPQIQEAMKTAGADAFVLKEMAPEQLHEVIAELHQSRLRGRSDEQPD